MLDDLTAWQINTDKKYKYFQTQLPKPDLHRRCRICIKTDALRCKHCFYCASAKHLQTGCLKRLQDRKTKQKTRGSCFTQE